MKLRDTYLAKQTVLGVSGTEILDVNIQDPLLGLTVILEGRYDTAADYDDHPLYKDVSKVELVDGSDVLLSVSVPQAEALDAYFKRAMPYLKLVSKAGEETVEAFSVWFSRSPWDEAYWVEPTKHVNLQVRVTYACVVDASHWAANEQKLSVILHTMTEHEAPSRGFLMTKEVYSWSTATAGDETIDLPIDYPYRAILLRKFLSGERADEAFTNVKVSCDTDRFVPVDIVGSHLAWQNAVRFGMLRQSQLANKRDAEVVYSPLADVRSANITCSTTYRIADVAAIDADQVTVDLTIPPAASTDASAAETTDRELTLTTFGFQPHHTLLLPFGDLCDPRTWFDPTEYGSVRLIVSQGGTSGTGEIVLQQLRRYE